MSMDSSAGRRCGDGLGRSWSLEDHYRPREYPLFSPVSDWLPAVPIPPASSGGGSQDFEFSLCSSGMISADEIFRNGKMLPCSGSCIEENVIFSSSTKSNRNHERNPAAAIRRQNSMPVAISSSRTTPIAAATCSSRWRSIFHRAFRNSSSSGSDKASDIASSSSSRRFLLLNADFGEESTTDESIPAKPKAKKSDQHSSKQKSDESRGKSVRNRVHPRNEFWIQQQQQQQQGTTTRRRDSNPRSSSVTKKDIPWILYDQESSQGIHKSVKVTPVLNMPVCMGDSLKLGVFDHRLAASRRKK